MTKQIVKNKNIYFLKKKLIQNILDNISYKHIKDIIHDEDYDGEYFDVEIKDVECDRVGYCKTQFKFEMNDKTFVVSIEYSGSSTYALMIMELEAEEDESEESDEDDYNYLCPNRHWGGQYGCDLCGDHHQTIKDSDNQEMEKEWLNNSNKYRYKLHKKWLEEKAEAKEDKKDEE